MSESLPSVVPPSRLLVVPLAPESAWKRWICLVLGLAITAGFFSFIHTFHQPGPGSPGIDENAYLVAGKNLAQHFQIGLHPATPYAYVGPMWIRADSGWYYPKYPFGVPVLNAIAIWVAGGHDNFAAGHVSPICATLAVLGMFLLIRQLAGSLMALLGAAALATNPTMMQLSLVPSSHAPAICFVVWGIYALICWSKTGHLGSGIAAGLLLGFTGCIRYSEGLLGLPLGVAVLCGIVAVMWSSHWKRWRLYLRAVAPLLAWAAVIGTLLIFNRMTMGHWTGYDSTNESEGFGWDHFKNKWEGTIQQLHMYGLFLLLPLGVQGMLLMLFGRSWRVGLTMILWFVPGTLLYMAYYWGNFGGVSYLRFFLTLYPPVIASAMWLLAMAVKGVMARPENAGPAPRWKSVLASVSLHLAVCIFIGALIATAIYSTLPELRRDVVLNGNQVYSAKKLIEAAPAARRGADHPSPVLFVEESGFGGGRILFLQFAADGDWYSSSAFSDRGGRGMGGRGGGGRFGGPGGNQQADPDAPMLFDPARRAELDKLYNSKSSTDLTNDETRMIADALKNGRGVYAMTSPLGALTFKSRMSREGFECKVVTHWEEPFKLAEEETQTSTSSRDRFRGGFGGGPPGRSRGGMGGFRNGGGGFGPPGGSMRGGDPQKWEVVQVVGFTPPPAPAIAPATMRAIVPATTRPVAPATSRATVAAIAPASTKPATSLPSRTAATKP